MFPAMRTMFGLHGRRRRAKRTQTLPVLFQYRNGNTEIEHVGLADYPFAQVMPILGTPGFFEDAVPSGTHTRVQPGTGWWFALMPDKQARIDRLTARKRGAVNIGIPNAVPLGAFYQLLAKIAHSFTYAFMVANAGPNDAPIPFFLRDIILAPRNALLPEAPYFIGCAYWADGSRIDSLWTDGKAYTIKLKNFDYGENREKRVMVVQIQLFAHLSAPVYEVVVGGWI
jgi:hypothetical protein